MSRHELVVLPDGSVRVADPEARAALRARPGAYRLIVDAPSLLVLQREAERSDAAATPRTRVLMAGEIVSRLTVMEITNIIVSANYRGELHVFGNGYHRSLFLDEGALKHAASDDPNDRLGEVLFRLGVLSRSALAALGADASNDHRLGQALVEQHGVTEEKLFEYVQRQAEQVFYGALLVGSGSYAFCLPAGDEAPSGATMHLPVQAMLMEGVQRVDEMALFRERIPHGQLCPLRRDGARPTKPPETEALRVMELADGSRTILDIARETSLGEFATTKCIFHLMQQGLLTLRSVQRVDEDSVRRLVGSANDVMRDICMAVATYGGLDKLIQTLSAWLTRSSFTPYLGDTVDEDGSLEPSRVAASLARVDDESPLDGLQQALHEFVAFALFAAMNTLPLDQGVVLSRDVNRRVRAIRV